MTDTIRLLNPEEITGTRHVKLSNGKVVTLKYVEETIEQNKLLRNLLKECREHFITYKRDDLDKGYVVYDGSYLIDKISQVLADNKIQANTVACNKIQENEQ